ncbi:MAG TPA: alpha/beta hydrolase [Jatrophihabitantaceae bacterium]|jgi:hypothetical protein
MRSTGGAIQPIAREFHSVAARSEWTPNHPSGHARTDQDHEPDPGPAGYGSSLIALPGGTSHANSLSGNTCLDNRIAAYLAKGTLPRRKPGNGPDTTCAPRPAPAPGG